MYENSFGFNPFLNDDEFLTPIFLSKDDIELKEKAFEETINWLKSFIHE